MNSIHRGIPGLRPGAPVQPSGWRKPVRFAAGREDDVAGPDSYNRLLGNPRTPTAKLAAFLKLQSGDEARLKVAEKFLRLLLESDKPDELAGKILPLLDQRQGSAYWTGFFEVLHRFNAHYAMGANRLTDDFLPLLRLLLLMTHNGATPLHRRVTSYYAQELLDDPHAERRAETLLPRLEYGFRNPDGSGLRQLRFLREAEDPLYLPRFRRDCETLIAQSPCVADRRQIVGDLLRLKSPGLENTLALAGRELLNAIDENATGMPGFSQLAGLRLKASLSPVRKELVRKQQAAMALDVLQAFRKDRIQPPDEVMGGLLQRLNAVNAGFRGKDLPTSYDKPVFSSAWEVRYLEAVLRHSRSIPFALDLVRRKSPVADTAQRHLLHLLRQPAFVWELRDRDADVRREAIELLGKVLQEARKNRLGGFYREVRQYILDAVEDKPMRDEEGQPFELAHPSGGTVSSAVLARDLLRHFVHAMGNVPGDIFRPLSARALLGNFYDFRAADPPGETAPPASAAPSPPGRKNWFDLLMEMFASAYKRK